MRVVLPCLLAALIVCCGDPQGFTCTDDLRVVTVTVTDTAGQPLENLSTRTTVRATRVALPRDSTNPGPVIGHYPVVDDHHGDLLKPGDNILDFAAWDAFHFTTATFVVASGSCHVSKREGPDTIVAAQSRDASRVQTDSAVYTLKREFSSWRAYPVAIYRNTTSAPVYFAPCRGWWVRRTGADSTRRLDSNIAWACGGGRPTDSIAPGEAMIVRVVLSSNDSPHRQPPLQLEWLIGWMRVELRLCREYEAESDDCDLLPQAERESNAFLVRF